jgi:hypothetical protein
VSDQLGRLVRQLRSQADGSVRWQPGAKVPAGLYFVRSADGNQLIRLLRSDARQKDYYLKKHPLISSAGCFFLIEQKDSSGIPGRGFVASALV